MSDHAGLASARPLATDVLIMAAARRWREARDGDRPVQPALHAMLAPSGHAMLAPVFDSLMRLCESRFDQKLCTGCMLAPSADEHLLCRVVADPSLLDGIGSCRIGGGMDRAFACAVHSARIMLAMVRNEIGIAESIHKPQRASRAASRRH